MYRMYRRTTLVEARQPNRRPHGLADELALIAREQGRIAESRLDPDEVAYQEWKRQMGYDRPLSRQEYEVLFHIYC